MNTNTLCNAHARKARPKGLQIPRMPSNQGGTHWGGFHSGHHSAADMKPSRRSRQIASSLCRLTLQGAGLARSATRSRSRSSFDALCRLFRPPPE
eukprot:8079667-Alexandrium_andersonii.AAC.1